MNPSKLDVWVLAGQSNMEGCGPLEGALESDPNVWSFASRGEWEVAREPLHRLAHSYTPVHADIAFGHLPEDQRGAALEEWRRQDATRLAGAGLGVAFGREMNRTTGRPVGLLPCAHGGTSLEQWSEGKRDQGPHSLYGAMLDRIERAGGHLRGVLWYQGESDCSPELSVTYGERLARWVEALRRDLNRPELPFFAVQLGRVVIPRDDALATPSIAPDIEAWNRVRREIAELPTRLAHCAVTSAIDLDLSDFIHIGTPGLIRLGKRLARLALAQGDESAASPRLEGVALQPVAAFPEPHAVELRFSGVAGGWNPRTNIAGFSVHDRDGLPHPTLCVVNAAARRDQPSTIRVLLNGQVEDECFLAYGAGRAPVCNAVDDADMPLLTFTGVPLLPLTTSPSAHPQQNAEGARAQ